MNIRENGTIASAAWWARTVSAEMQGVSLSRWHLTCGLLLHIGCVGLHGAVAENETETRRTDCF